MSESPFRIFIGTDPSQVVAHQVLAHTIRRHASIPVEITPMIDLPLRLPVPVDPDHRARVEFTFTRFLIPELCRFEGRALYVDADMLVFGDVAELAALPFGGAKVLCTYQRQIPELWRDKPGFEAGRNSAVMLLDCSRLDWDAAQIVAGLDEGRYTYEQLVYRMGLVAEDEVADTIPPEWNHLEHLEPSTRLLHYTVVRTQPWKAEKNPLGAVWVDAFAQAVEAGAVAPDEVERGIAAGHLMPELASFLHLAPGRRTPATDAAAPRELALARMRIASLERTIEQMRASRGWKVGTSLAGAAGVGRRLTRRARSAIGR